MGRVRAEVNALLPARVLGEEGSQGAPDEVEIGPLTEDAKALAGRIVVRLRT